MDTRNAGGIASRMKRTNNKKRRTRRNESVKVVYISTPMKVTTSASKFKSLVQQLTGIHSDICRIMDDSNGTTDFEVFPDDDVPKHLDDHHAFSTQVDDEQLQEMFPLDLFLDLNSSDLEVDVLCSSYAM